MQAAGLVAAKRGDYATLGADGDATFAAFGKSQFGALEAQFRSRLQEGREVSPLGELKKRGQAGDVGENRSRMAATTCLRR
jgi:hypothetical protein